jgi:simple sugar transport system permease protein
MIFESIHFLETILAAGIRMATPVMLAALGEAVTEKGGILNIGVEGTMLVGAFSGFATAYLTNNPWIGILVGSLSGCIVGIIMAFLSVTRGSDQSVTGIVLNLFCLGITSVLFWRMFSDKRVMIPGLAPIEIPLLSKIPFLGPILFSQISLVYITLILIPLVYILINRTKFGLSLRAVGEHPLASETSGINVHLIRYAAVIIGSALMGLAGATLSVGILGGFRDNMTAGRGYIALAIVVLGKWNPFGIFAGALLFGIADALQLRLQAMGVGIPHQILLMIPYVLTILVLIGFAGGAVAPAGLARPYPEEDS